MMMPEPYNEAIDQRTEEELETRVESLVAQMTLPEKIGQMTQVENNSIRPEEVAKYGVGSVLSGGGGNPTPNTPETWAHMVHSYQEAALRTRLGIPLLYGVDGVHGHSNLRGAVVFPHNIGLGATRDPDLVEAVSQITAYELLATGVRWNFAPSVSVPQDIRWGRTYEGYSENTDRVTLLAMACLRGLENRNGETQAHPMQPVLGSVKHFVGDGGTAWGSTLKRAWMDDTAVFEGAWSIDQGMNEEDERTLRAVHLPPYRAAIQAGAKNIMASHSGWGGQRLHAHKYLLTDLLKGEMKFKGFLVSDWLGIEPIDTSHYSRVVRSVNAGLDMVMVPYDFKPFIQDLTKAVERGDVPIERIDDAVHRILRVKLEIGLFEDPQGDPSLLGEIGSTARRHVAREAVRKSLVLLKNDGATLPLPKDLPYLFIAGQAADDIGLQCGGWTIEWQGGVGETTHGTTILEGIRRAISPKTLIQYRPEGDFDHGGPVADVCVVVISEPPYAEGAGDRADLNLPASDCALLERVRPHCRKLVVILLSGRPLIITKPLESWDALIAAWLPGTEGAGVADVLFGEFPFTGRLSYTWPRSMDQIPHRRLDHTGASAGAPLFPYGYGLDT